MSNGSARLPGHASTDSGRFTSWRLAPASSVPLGSGILYFTRAVPWWTWMLSMKLPNIVAASRACPSAMSQSGAGGDSQNLVLSHRHLPIVGEGSTDLGSEGREGTVGDHDLHYLLDQQLVQVPGLQGRGAEAARSVRADSAVVRGLWSFLQSHGGAALSAFQELVQWEGGSGVGHHLAFSCAGFLPASVVFARSARGRAGDLKV